MAGTAQMKGFQVITPIQAFLTKLGHSKPAGSIFFPIVGPNVLSYN